MTQRTRGKSATCVGLLAFTSIFAASQFENSVYNTSLFTTFLQMTIHTDRQLTYYCRGFESRWTHVHVMCFLLTEEALR
jgi:hypothetical protein